MNNPSTQTEETQYADEDWELEAIGDKALPASLKPIDFEMFLSTDGKHTVHVKGNDSNKKAAMELAAIAYDWVVKRYGLKPNGFTNSKPAETQTVSKQQALDALCTHELFSIKESKSEKNPGRKFRQCSNQACPNSFLGWV